jgi:transposase
VSRARVSTSSPTPKHPALEQCSTPAVSIATHRHPDRLKSERLYKKSQPTLDPKRLVFIDETSATRKMARLYGRSPQGERLVDKVPYGHRKTTTFIAALRNDRVTAPYLLDGPMNGPNFIAYVEQSLAPTLKTDDIVLMDRVRLHMVDGIQEAIEARGARVRYLPPYSPDLNPIEQLFAKLKNLLRRAAARTVNRFWKAIAHFLKQVSKSEAPLISSTQATVSLTAECSSILCRPRGSQQ